MEPGRGVVREDDADRWEEAAAFAPAGRWEARLELGYASRGAETVPVLRRHVGPLRVQRHFVPEPGLCEHVIVHPPGGIVGGDRLGIEVEVGPDAAVRLTTPGATKWYRSAAAEAEQDILLRVRRGGRLAWMPQEQIVFSGARARSALRIEAEAGATILAWEITVLGRQHGDEPFVSGSWRSRLAVELGGRLVLDERGAVAGGPEGAGLMGAAVGWMGAEVLATVVVVGSDPRWAEAQVGSDPRWAEAQVGSDPRWAEAQVGSDPRWAEAQVSSALEVARAVPAGEGHVGVTMLEEGLLVGRFLGRRSAEAFAWVAAVAAALGPRLGWAMATTPRIWRT
jgi:urease accessory protein